MGWTVHSGVIISYPLDISGVPSKPRIINTEKEIESSFTLKWLPPSYDGGDNNIMYQVEWGKKPITDKTDRFVVQKIPDTSREIENLENEVEYEFRVMAKNQAGAGEPDIMFFTVKESTGMYTIETKYVNFAYTEAWKSQDFNGVSTRDLAIPVRRSNQLSYGAIDVGSWPFVSSNEPVKNGCEVIYEMFHILHCGFWNQTNDQLPTLVAP